MISRAFLICLLAAAIGAVHAKLRPLTVTFGVDEPPASSATAESAPVNTAVFEGKIDVRTARALQDAQDVVFVDARNADEFKLSRLARAEHLPPDVFWSGEPPAFVSNMPREWRYVIYCKSDLCDAADLVAVRLKEFGYPKLMIMKGGFEAWTKAGYPLEGGK